MDPARAASHLPHVDDRVVRHTDVVVEHLLPHYVSVVGRVRTDDFDQTLDEDLLQPAVVKPKLHFLHKL